VAKLISKQISFLRGPVARIEHSFFVKGEFAPMRNALRRRFWLETALAIITGILFIITLVQRDWIEVVFNVDPDNRSGSLEWLIVGVLLVVTLTLITLASFEWRRARASVS
jgi:hypothetical protein